MFCYRKHQFSNRRYQVHFQTNSVKLINNQNAKYTIHLGLRSEVEWFYKDGHLEAFGLRYRGKQKLFHLDQVTALKLKKALGGNAIFLNIKQAYRALLIIGRGSFGKVFKVESLLDSQCYACKSIKIDKFYEEEDVQNEILIQNEMEHPSILKINEVYKEEGQYYIITDYAVGGNLKNFLQTRTLTDNEIILIMKQVLQAIEHINQKGYVHRDIKPENILLMKYYDLNDLKLTDFGFATKLTEIQTNHPYCGTPGYMAPEIVNFNGKIQYNEQCDIFSAGVLFYKLLTGADLFKGTQSEIYFLQEKFNLSLIDHVKIKSKFKTLLFGMLQSDPNVRINIYDAIQQLQKIEQFYEIDPEYEVPLEEGINKLKQTQIHQLRK